MVPNQRFPAAKTLPPALRFLGNDEPGIDDMLRDEVVVRLMARDGIAAADLRTLIGTVRERYCPRV